MPSCANRGCRGFTLLSHGLARRQCTACTTPPVHELGAARTTSPLAPSRHSARTWASGAPSRCSAPTPRPPSTVQPIPSDHNPTIADSDFEDPKGELIRRLEQMAQNITLNKTVFGPMLDITPDSVEASDPVEKKPRGHGT